VVAIRVDDVAPSGYAMDRATIRQRKTGRPVRFELTDHAALVGARRDWLLVDALPLLLAALLLVGVDAIASAYN
jgi:hypothetical protein